MVHDYRLAEIGAITCAIGIHAFSPLLSGTFPYHGEQVKIAAWLEYPADFKTPLSQDNTISHMSTSNCQTPPSSFGEILDMPLT